ncbi:hypothetical protein QBC46DRAFT_462203 [Diplogelasinospora grovesii]|uniref:Nephrocystin 3-like N-terminal domain-containing protein n=1 Tax=Diplogelasinospora grovesii TaxID=303347 RepID=A0AAN6MXA8_9PEZI|nr:hypothetical protein QBC46DRAFT_462203 [Diplogelasinospora grovesii]
MDNRSKDIKIVKGKPGFKKLTLLRYALGNTTEAPNIGDGAFTPLGLFRSLLHQVLSQVPDALPDLVNFFQRQHNTVSEPGEKWQWHLSDLQRFFQSSLPKVLKSRPVWLFIDALDECGTENIVNLVKELPPTRSQFRICFTYHHYPILSLNCRFEICFKRENKEDISTYIQSRRFKSYILTAFTIPGMHKILKISTSLKLIQWICFTTRPLAEDYVLDCDRMKRRVQTLSCGLAEIIPSFNTQSVKDFFVEKGLSALNRSLKSAETETFKADLVVGIAHYWLSRTCIRYLVMEEIAQLTTRDRNNLMSTFPLLDYATTSETRKVLVYNNRPPEGTTIVHIVSRYQLMGPLQMILQRAGQVSTNVDAKDSRGRTPLSWAAENGNEAVVKMLLDTGKVDVDAKDNSGWTPLSWAAAKGREAVVKMLLDTGKVDVDAKDDENGQTPLSWAAGNGREAVVKMLQLKPSS